MSLITGFFAFRKIDPYFMGIWSALTVFETYATIMRLGIVNGMNRELPHAMGEGDKVKAHKFASTTFAYTIFDIVLLLIIAPFVLWNLELSAIHVAGISVSVIRVCLSFYTTYLSSTFRSDDSFNKLSNIQMIVLLMKLLFCPLVLFGFYGFLAYELIAILTNTILLHYYRPFKILPKFYKPEFIQLIKIGFPIFITSSAISYIDTIPRLYILKFSTEKMLGLYSPVLMLLTTVAILPNTLSAYMYPKFSYQIGQTKDLKEIWPKLLKIYILSFLFICFFVAVGYFLLDYFVYYFPKYAESLPYLKLSLLICPFVFFKLGNLLNVVLKKYNYMISFALTYAAIQIASLYIISQHLTDILDIVIYSQVVTSVLVLLISLLLNYKLVLEFKKPQIA